jgi:hypothetical protein
MARIEGSTDVKTWKGSYAFATDGGAQGTITLRSNDGPIPVGSFILTGILEVTTALDSGGSATAALTVEGANDTVTATAFGSSPWSTTGRKSVIPVATGATSLKTTAARNPAVVIATADLTDGVFNLILTYR